MARLWGRDGSRWTSVARHWGDIREYQKHKGDPELGEGKIGVTPMTDAQIADKKIRDARKAKTPMARQVYTDSAAGR
jgi:hypothetical protein